MRRTFDGDIQRVAHAMTRRSVYGAMSLLAFVVLAIAAMIMASTTGRWEQEAQEKQPDFQDPPTLPAN